MIKLILFFISLLFSVKSHYTAHLLIINHDSPVNWSPVKLESIKNLRKISINHLFQQSNNENYVSDIYSYDATAEISNEEQFEVVQELLEKFQKEYQGGGKIQFISLDDDLQKSRHHDLYKRQGEFLSPSIGLDHLCPLDEATCKSSFNSCSNHGSCKNKTHPLLYKSCFLCDCTTDKGMVDEDGKPVPGYNGPVSWGGAMCQFEEISIEFQLVFWSSVLMILITIFSVTLLSGVSDSSGTEELGGIKTHPKRD